MREIVLQGFVVVFVGVAVAAAVGTGVVVSQATAFHAETSRPITFVRCSLEVQTECLAEDFRGHATAGVDAELLIILLGCAGLKPFAVILDGIRPSAGVQDHNDDNAI